MNTIKRTEMSAEADWSALVNDNKDAPFAQSAACKAAFFHLSEWLGADRLNTIVTPETISAIGLEILRDGRTAQTLREAGFRFEIPKDRDFPWILAVNGNQAQRDLVAPPGNKKPSVADALSAWPQMIITFVTY